MAMGKEHQHQWRRKLPWVLLGRRTAFHVELQATPAQMVFGQDPKIPGDLTHPMADGETPQEIILKVQAVVNRPPAQTVLHREIPDYMPHSTMIAKRVYTKKAKKSPLSPIWEGPYPIIERIGKSCLKIKTAEYKNGEPRTEIRHWSTCYPAHPEDTQSAVKPTLGRKPLNIHAEPFEPENV